MSDNKNNYDDIIGLPHFVSRNRRHMSLSDRAAQFAPFAALTGYEESINETARLTQIEIEPGEAERDELDRRLKIVVEHIKEHPSVTILYFVPDDYKYGGAYRSFSFKVRKIDMVHRELIAEDKRQFNIDSILSIDGDIIEEELKKEVY